MTVNAPEPPEVTAEFDESSITLGEDATLRWSSTNASACGGAPSIGSPATSGSKTYTPSSAGSFSVTVTCTGAGGSADDIASVTVYERPTVRAWFGESSITLGEDATLRWSSTNASACGGSPAIGSTATSGARTYTPSSAGSFSVRVTCTGAGGSDSDIASVTVYEPPEVSAWFNTSSITLGEQRDAELVVEQREPVQRFARDRFDVDLGDEELHAVEHGQLQREGDLHGRRRQRQRQRQSDRLRAADADGPGAGRGRQLHGDVDERIRGDELQTGGEVGERELRQRLHRERHFAELRGKTPAIYTYRVRACVSSKCGVWSSTDTTKVPPGAPTLTVPATDADGDYTASWTSVTGAMDFELEEKPPGGSFGNIYDDDGTSQDITGNTPGIYMYRARACAGTGNCGGWSSTKTTKVPPGAPTLTAPATDADGTYDATWTSPSGATSYELQEQVGSGGWSASETLTTTTKSYPGKTPAIYKYRVRACAGSGNCGDWSSTGTTKVPPGAPRLTVPATDADGSYRVRWTSPSGATSYELQEKSGSGSLGDVYTGSSTSTNITGKAHGTYSYRVHACAGTGNCGGWSSTESVSINNAPVAVDDTTRTAFDTAKVIDVLANDTDADGDDLTVTVVTTPADGTATITSDADGNDTLVTYTPDSGHPGEDTFDYTVFDGTASDTGTVEVTVDLVKVTPNPSTTGSYTLSWEATFLADRYWVRESVPGGESLSSFHSTTSVDYTGKATGEYTYDVFRCKTSPGPGEICEGYGSAKASVILPITPGNLPYRSGVTKGGDAYVNVPIAPVPGVNGLAPRLSIDYSGGRERHRSDQELPADMIGYGWRIGGFSTIRRCVKGTDDSDGISFNDEDALCLDGEPLTKIKGMHLEAPAEYRTARESFAKVVLKDSATGDWFEVHLPDGTVREYGGTLDSQLWKPARVESGTEPAEPAAAFLWSINKQTDAFGNVMTYKSAVLILSVICCRLPDSG